MAAGALVESGEINRCNKGGRVSYAAMPSGQPGSALARRSETGSCWPDLRVTCPLPAWNEEAEKGANTSDTPMSVIYGVYACLCLVLFGMYTCTTRGSSLWGVLMFSADSFSHTTKCSSGRYRKLRSSFGSC